MIHIALSVRFAMTIKAVGVLLPFEFSSQVNFESWDLQM